MAFPGRTTLIILLLFCFSFYTHAQGPSWFKRIGSEEENYLVSTLTNAAGEIFMTGSFINGKGQMPVGNVLLKSPAPEDFRCGFVARFDASGRTIWAQVLESNRFGAMESAVLDAKGNLYVHGRYHGQLTFNGQTFLEPSYGPKDFIAKYDSAGRPLWLKMLPAEAYLGVALAMDSQDNLYAACEQARKESANSVVSTGIVLYKFDANGNQLLASTITTSPTVDLGTLMIDSKQQAVLWGRFMTSVTIGSQVFEDRQPGSAFLLKCNADGSIKWATQIGKGEAFNAPRQMVFDAEENIYIAGTFSIKTDQVSLVLKYDPEGNQTWRFTVDRETNSFYFTGISGQSLLINKDQDILLAGNFKGDVMLGDTVLHGAGTNQENDFFLTRIKKDGRVAGAIQSIGDGQAHCVMLLPAGGEEFYLSGGLDSTKLSFDGSSAAGKPVQNLDIFLYKGKIPFQRAPAPLPVEEPVTRQPVSIPNIITPNGDASNQYFVIGNLDPEEENKLEVYNRWGKLVYRSGTYRNNWAGEGLAAGTYYYVLHQKQTNRFTKGWVSIIR